MKMLHKHIKNTGSNVEHEEEQRKCLCSNSTGTRCSSLNLSEQEKSELIENKLQQLAQILIELYVMQKISWKENHSKTQ